MKYCSDLLIPLTFYNLGNLTQQQEFNHIHWCRRQNKAPLNSEGAVTSKVSELRGSPGIFRKHCLHAPCISVHTSPQLGWHTYPLLTAYRNITPASASHVATPLPALWCSVRPSAFPRTYFLIHSEYLFKGFKVSDLILKMYPVTLDIESLCNTGAYSWMMHDSEHLFVYGSI